jgi:sec-independent protein translocase protein TatB
VFNLSGSEIVVILLLALVVLGPEKLPEAIRRFGRVYGELRRMSKGFQSEFKEAFDEPMRELRATAQMTTDAVRQAIDAPDQRPSAETPTPSEQPATSDSSTVQPSDPPSSDRDV